MHSEDKASQPHPQSSHAAADARTVGSWVLVGILPVEEEANDFDTGTLAEELSAELRQAAQAEDGYIVQDSSLETTRGADFFQLLVQSVLDNKEALGLLIGSAVGAVNLLAKQRRVDEIEVTVGDKTLKLKGADRQTVQTLITQLEKTHPEAAKKVTKATAIAVTGRVSKHQNQHQKKSSK